MNERRPGKLELLLSLAATLVMTWSILPPEDRRWIRLSMAWRARRLLAVLAALEGRAGMADELAGRDPAPRYVTAYRLALLRDRAGRLLDSMRP